MSQRCLKACRLQLPASGPFSGCLRCVRALDRGLTALACAYPRVAYASGPRVHSVMLDLEAAMVLEAQGVPLIRVVRSGAGLDLDAPVTALKLSEKKGVASAGNGIWCPVPAHVHGLVQVSGL